MRILPTRYVCLLGLGLLSLPAISAAAEYYVAPNGSGSGTKTSPMSLADGLSNGKPGDTIWLRGGTYKGTFTCWASGTASSPIRVRQYPGERAIIDGGSTQDSGITAACGYVWFEGFEVFFSDTKRTTTQTLSFPTDIMRGQGAGTQQTAGVPVGIKFINMIIHDGFNGFGVWKDALDAELYGNIIYYNGWDAPDRGHGHGIYTQNEVNGTKHILENIMFSNYSHGLHIYGTGDMLNNYDIQGNVAFDNGVLSQTSGYATNFRIQGDGPAPKNVVFKNNYSFFSPRQSGGNNVLGNDNGCSNMTVTGNYFIAQNGTALIKASGCTGITMTGNRFFGQLSGFTSSQYPQNTYLTSKPSGAEVFVRPNQYEAGRANIIVYNWSSQGTISADVSGVLSAGDAYEVRDAQNFLGAPILTGTYTSGSIAIPMNSSTVPAVVGSAPLPATHTAAEFGVFVLRRTSAGTTSPAPNAAPVVSAGAAQTVTLPNSVTLNGSATDDGQPSGSTLSVSWSKVSGPGTVTFGSATKAVTTASFSAAGSYVLRLTASDSALTSTSDVTITVNTGADTTAPALSGISAAVSGSAATVVWTTNEASDSQVEYGPTSSYGSQSALNSSMVTSHSVALSGLTAGITYNYRVKSRDAAGNLAVSGNYTFTVPTGTTTGPVKVYLEAEGARLVSPMAAKSYSGATVISTSKANSGTATFTANVATAGTYVIWGRVNAPDSNADSFFVSVNGGTEDVYDMAEGLWSSAWQWTKVNGRNGGAPNAIPQRTFSLKAGANTIVFRGREAGSILDKILVTNDLSFVPAN